VKVAYQTERVTLYHGDAADAPAVIGKHSVDLIVTDPPYGVDFRSNRRTETFDFLAGDKPLERDTMAAVLAANVPTLRVCRHLYIFGPEHLVDGLPIGGRSELVWDKGIIGMGDLSLPWGPQHEPITFGSYVPSKKNREDGYGRLAARMRAGSVLTVQRAHSRGAKRHPTEKPVALLRRLIESSSSLGELVYDPFAGSGSTLVAAVLEGRRAVGVELDEKHVETAVRRLKWAEQVADSIELDGEVA
jgi:DNA modification methylase